MTNQNSTLADIRLAHSARHNAITLSLAQAINGSIGPIAISLGALSGAYLMPDKLAYATLPVAAYSIGTALFALPVAMITNKIGRKYGFILGTIIGILGSLLCSYGLLERNFIALCTGFIVLGNSSAFVQQYRFAAADHGTDKFKSRAISWVLSGGILAAIIGPQTALLTKDSIASTPFVGAFLAMSALLIFGILILMALKRIPTQLDIQTEEDKNIRPLIEIMKQPKFIVALVCAVSSYALMTFMMTGAPLAMTHHGHSQAHAITGIQWHVMAMFAPSFFTGLLIVRFGKSIIIAAGLILLILCALTALLGYELWNFWVSLILLGVGWNFGFIGATALLGETYHPFEKNKVQGVHDLILFSSVAISALLSGVTLTAFGWHGVALVLLPITTLSLLSLLWLRLKEKGKVSEGL